MQEIAEVSGSANAAISKRDLELARCKAAADQERRLLHGELEKRQEALESALLHGTPNNSVLPLKSMFSGLKTLIPKEKHCYLESHVQVSREKQKADRLVHSAGELSRRLHAHPFNVNYTRLGSKTWSYGLVG